MIIIRRVQPSEAEVLTQIALAAKRHWGYPERWMEIWTPQLTFDARYFEENESWAAVDAEYPIAFLTFLDKQGIAWVDNLWVRPDFMGRGVGRILFAHAVTLARRRGYEVLQLEADPNAAGFYEKMGMVRVGERRSEVDGTPRILPLMELTL